MLNLKLVSEAKENAKLNKKVKTYLIKLTEGYKDLSAEAELKKLDDKAQESVLAKIYAIIVRYHLKEHTVVENAQKLTELLDKDLFDNLPNSSKQVRSIYSEQKIMIFSGNLRRNHNIELLRSG